MAPLARKVRPAILARLARPARVPAHPEVLTALEKLAGEWLRRHERVGLKMLFEVLRWTTGLGASGEIYRLNSNYGRATCAS